MANLKSYFCSSHFHTFTCMFFWMKFFIKSWIHNTFHLATDAWKLILKKQEPWGLKNVNKILNERNWSPWIWNLKIKACSYLGSSKLSARLILSFMRSFSRIRLARSSWRPATWKRRLTLITDDDYRDRIYQGWKKAWGLPPLPTASHWWVRATEM